MATIRWQLRRLILWLVVAGVLWIHLVNYLQLGQTPLTWARESPQDLVALWVGALAMGLLLDALAGLYLRSFFATLARLEAGRPVPPAHAEAAAVRAIDFPARASLALLGLAAGLTLVFHTVDDAAVGGLWHILLDPAQRGDQLETMLQEMTAALILAVLLFTFSQRLLQRAVANFGLRQIPAGRKLPVGVRFFLIVLTQAVMYTSLFTQSGAPNQRMVWLYIVLGLLSGLVGYLVAMDAGQDLHAIAQRLRVLAAGVRPDLFHRLAVTGRDEVGELLAAINVLQDRVEDEFRAISRDLQAARSIQTEMLPRDWQPPPGWDLAVRLTPAQEVGGDFYDLISLGEGRFGVAVGDAAGKGLPAALLMASTVSLLRSHAPLHDRPGAVLAAVNRLLCSSLPPMTFVTAAYAVVDTGRREVTIASAGHLPPIIGGREAEPISSLPLGVEPDVHYLERTYSLGPGESFLLYSDGVVEARDQTGGLLGTSRVEELMGQSGATAGALLEGLVAAVAQHVDGSRSLADDMTVLVLVPPTELRLELPSRHGSELIAAAETARFVRTHGPADRADDAATAVGEACLNAILHGNGLGAEQPVVVHLLAGPGWLEATVTDNGPIFSPPEQPPVLQEQMEGDGPIGGWGLHVIRAMADAMRIEPLDQGKQVCLRFYARGGAQ